MKPILLFLILNLTTYLVSGQEKYIEVEATDYIVCPIDGIQYSIIGGPDGGSVSEVLQYLNEKKITYKFDESSFGQQTYTIFISFDSWDQLETSISEFKANDLIAVGQSLGTFHELTEKETNTLYKKIIAKGKLEAERIASAMNTNAHELLEVKYKHKEVITGWTAYPPFSAIGNNELEIPEVKNQEMEMSRTLILRFSAN